MKKLNVVVETDRMKQDQAVNVTLKEERRKQDKVNII
jgi:hypothetical protein